MICETPLASETATLLGRVEENRARPAGAAGATPFRLGVLRGAGYPPGFAVAGTAAWR